MSRNAIALEYNGRTFVPFHDHSYRWINMKFFTWVGIGASDQELLDALVQNWRYRDTYLSADSHEQDSGAVHGPYPVGEINARSFRMVSQSAAVALLEEFLQIAQRFSDARRAT